MACDHPGFLLSEKGRERKTLALDSFGWPDGLACASCEHEGTGLGLAMVRRLLNLQGGRVGLVSELGQGSTFAVWIPRRVETLTNPES